MTSLQNYSFKELYDLYLAGKKISLPTPDGLKEVVGAYRKFGPGIHLVMDDGSEIKGSIYHLVMSNGEFLPLMNLDVGDTLTGSSFREEKTIVSRESIEPQNWYDFSLDYDQECYILDDILHHNSGKSLIIYCILRWYTSQKIKCILICPSTSLVEQMYSDFIDYANGKWNVERYTQKIYAGYTKEIAPETKVVITTWQSIVNAPKKWFEQFGTLIGDEAHTFKANSLVKIMEKTNSIKYKIGTTGTIHNDKVNVLSLNGVFGPTYQVTTSKELMDKKTLADLTIKMLVLKYKDEQRKETKALDYQGEMDWLVKNEKRNKFIQRLACNTTCNTLLLFQYVDKHGSNLYEMIKDKAEGRKVFFIHGGVDTEERESIRQIAIKETNCIIIASYGTFSTGLNVPNIECIIFASPSKSKIRNLQSIGRGLRLKGEKTSCELIDIADDLSWKSKRNHTLNHATERLKIYSNEQFNTKIIELDF